jgi:photosynthetic reaction center cytochrome c subunit
MNARQQGWMTIAVLAAALLAAGCERPPQESVQRGYRGLGMVELFNPRAVAIQVSQNQAPAPAPAVPAGGPPASTVFKNLKVLNDLSVGELTRLMVSMTSWVSPDQGCAYCHAAGEDMSSDSLYTKVVARRMLQMTRHINSAWKDHVSTTGVTCYTCHRGKPVPADVWFENPGPPTARGMAGNRAGQNAPAPQVGLSSLPFDPFTPFLDHAGEIRVISTSALPAGNHHSIKQTEWTYALMMHISQSLGVNCTYCHNSRSFVSWDASTPQRTTAWYAIRTVRNLNEEFMNPLASTLPASQRGPLGDGPKINCGTCHQGVYKPLFGAKMLADYPELSGVVIKAAAEPAPVAALPAGVLARVLFEIGKTDLGPESMQVIATAAKALQENAALKVYLSGYADRTGNPAANLELAKQRAFAVRDALQAAGVADARIVLKKPEFVIGGAEAEARRVDLAAAN